MILLSSLELKCDEDFCSWNGDAILQAASQGPEDVLHDIFVTSSTCTNAQDLFKEHQKCVMSVFSSKSQTTKGEKLVCDYTLSCDTKVVHKDLKKHCLKSTKAVTECCKIADFLLNPLEEP